MKNKKGKIVKITLKNGETLRMTFDHPAMVIEDGKLVKKRAEELKKGERIPLAKKGYQGDLGDFQLGRFVGLYIAEGSISKEGCVYFSFNEKEQELIDFVKKVGEERLVSPVRITQDPRWQTTQVWLDSRVVVELVRRFCTGKRAKQKRLTSKLFGMSRDFRLGVLVGIYQGDGYERDMDFHTTNRKLRDAVAHLAASLGICYFKRTNKKNTKDGKSFTSYVLRMSTNSYSPLKPYFSSLKPAPSTIFKEYEDFWGVKIAKIEKPTYNQDVYDFEIEGNDHLFQMANGIITHNCCRLRLDLSELMKRGGGYFGANALTGSTGVVTLNMARIGYLAKSKKSFLNRVGRLMRLARESLEVKRKVVERFTQRGLYPYSRFYLRGNKERLGGYWNGHFSTIGLNGLNEGLLNLMGKNIATPEGQEFAEKVLDYMRDKLVDYQKETGNLYNLEATPAEGSLAPEEKVLVAQSDPQLTEIGPLIDQYLEKNKEKIILVGTSEVLKIPEGQMFTWGFNRKTLKMKKYPVTGLVRHPGKSMYEIETVSGRKVKVTGQHSVFSLNSEGSPQEVLVSNLESGTPIIVPNGSRLIKLIKQEYPVQPAKIGLRKEEKGGLKRLANSDLYWDKVKKIRILTPPKYVYDLEVDIEGKQVNNFLGGEGLMCLHNTSYRLAKMDKEKYPDIIVANEEKVQKGAAPFYTNSSQLPVDFTDDLFYALKLQDPLQTKYTGGCVEGGNKVLTDQGLMRIEEIVNHFEKLKPLKALSYNPQKGVSEWDEVVDAMAIDVKRHDKIRIRGERGLDMTTSDWHPFFVLQKRKVEDHCLICGQKVKNVKAFASHLRWHPACRRKYQAMDKYQVIEKRADQLKKGDYILQNSTNLYANGQTQLDKDLMWLVGFFIGDGCLSRYIDNRGGNNLQKHKVRFFSEQVKALEKARKILADHFDCQAGIIQNDQRSKALRELGTSQRSVADFFLNLGFENGKKVYDISVPQKVKQNLTRENLLSFLSGLMDSDGHIGKRDGDFEYYTVSADLADDLLEITTQAGLMMSKSRKRTHRSNEVDIYRLRIPTYQMTEIKDELESMVNPGRIKDNLSRRKRRRLPVVRVKEVSKVDVKDNLFYDLTTKRNHNYLAGKDCLVFVHNTVFHSFLGERLENGEEAKVLAKKIVHQFNLPYFTFTPTFSICPHCGYLKGEARARHL